VGDAIVAQFIDRKTGIRTELNGKVIEDGSVSNVYMVNTNIPGINKGANASVWESTHFKELLGDAGLAPGEGFVLRSDDGNYKLRIGLQSAYKFEPVYQEGDYGNRRAFFVLRPIFAGTFFKEWIRFWTSLELVSNPPYLLDSYVEVQPRPAIGVRAVESPGASSTLRRLWKAS
jgi:hypothetical protein